MDFHRAFQFINTFLNAVFRNSIIGLASHTALVFNGQFDKHIPATTGVEIRKVNMWETRSKDKFTPTRKTGFEQMCTQWSGGTNQPPRLLLNGAESSS